jgi:hypothetical protein
MVMLKLTNAESTSTKTASAITSSFQTFSVTTPERMSSIIDANGKLTSPSNVLWNTPSEITTQQAQKIKLLNELKQLLSVQDLSSDNSKMSNTAKASANASAYVSAHTSENTSTNTFPKSANNNLLEKSSLLSDFLTLSKAFQ